MLGYNSPAILPFLPFTLASPTINPLLPLFHREIGWGLTRLEIERAKFEGGGWELEIWEGACKGNGMFPFGEERQLHIVRYV